MLKTMCQNCRNCRFQKCQFSHTHNNNETFSAIETLEEVDNESDSYSLDDEIYSNPVCCDYGLCDFQQILCKTKSDLKTHLRNHHGIGIEH
jgi:hypothetical protein